jgi:hypothetical protein
VEELSVYLIGWRGYFGFCQTPSVLRDLDQWTRRRLRAIVWKQWKRGPARFAELRRRGVGRDLAAKTAGSPHRPLAAQQQPRAHHCAPERLPNLARPRDPRGPAGALTHRTAVYGPVRTVVWEGEAVRPTPIPILFHERNRPPFRAAVLESCQRASRHAAGGRVRRWPGPAVAPAS